MPQRSVALLRTKQGPWTFTGRGKKVTLTVIGLEGCLLVIQADRPFQPDTTIEKRIYMDGVHEIEAMPWTQLQVDEGDCSGVMAFVHCHKAA